LIVVTILPGRTIAVVITLVLIALMLVTLPITVLIAIVLIALAIFALAVFAWCLITWYLITWCLITRGLIAVLIALSVTIALIAAVTLIAFRLTVAVFTFLLFATLVNFALGFGQKAQVMFRMLLEIFHRDAVIAQLGITCQLIVFINDLLRRAAYLALGARAVENPVDDIADTAVRGIVAARLARPGFG
jgi:hypothetical protein